MTNFEIEITYNMICRPGQVVQNPYKRNHQWAEFYHDMEEMDHCGGLRSSHSDEERIRLPGELHQNRYC